MKYGQSIYWCKKLKEPDGFNEFAEPEEIKLKPKEFSLQPASGYSANQQFGENVNLYQNIICQPYEKWFGKFKEGDLFYTDGVKPSTDEEYYGQNANYRVDLVANQNKGIRVVLKRV